MEALDNIRNIKIYDTTLMHLEDVMDNYQKYMKYLDDFSLKELALFLQTLRRNELINNQETEFEPPLLVEMQLNSERKNSISMMADIVNSNAPLTLEDIKTVHKRLLKGTQHDLPQNYPYREKEVRVSEFINGEEVISYLPPESKEIIYYMNYILDYLNNDDNIQIETVFIKPMIAHAYIALLQPFRDGNTRLARLIEYSKMFDLTNKYFGKNYPNPILYLSKNYLMTRGNYRNNIKDIAIFHNDKTWNNWFRYNLNRIEDQLYYLNNTLNQYQERKKF